MRRPVDEAMIRSFMRRVGAAAERDGRIYFTGGATAVLMGWRASTIDVDIRLEPEQDSIFRALPEIKESLGINVELASPADFLPALPGWRERSVSIGREGRITFLHYDLVSQALAKVERGHRQDLIDVRTMLEHGWVDPRRARELFDAIQGDLVRFPSVDPASLRRKVEAAFGTGRSGSKGRGATAG